ncbi:protocadherin gamma-A11-like [Cheilinus undulatus]|uniref:protocadherin gamma-A11-like n=1 Tax=Cheilinus undulatus TaxID=241271 RepID=UPI001BD5EEB3|nr:protocadherin gamma-A11-like [Cheilinus undulatus]
MEQNGRGCPRQGRQCYAFSLLLLSLSLIFGEASGQIRYSISEEIKEGTAVGNIAKDLGIDPSILKTRGFRIVSGTAQTRFQVNQNDGILYINGNIDREEICQRTSVCVLNLKTVLENPLEIHYVAVEVLDVNDHAPSFPENNKRLQISESSLPGTKFQLHAALDPDGGVNSVQQYKLSSNNNFRLEVKERGKDGKVPILLIQSPLDREISSSHKLLLTALDGGKPPKTGTMEIIIDVLDVNDNAPIFTKDVYSAEINENSPVGTVVLRVNATDKDEGLNGNVSYSFGNVNSKVRKLFDVDASTGEITVKGQLDYEVDDSYEIDIQASDSGAVPLRTEKGVTVNIKDVNDNAPVIEVTSLSNTISEDSRPGTTVALISITDLDSGVNGKVISFVKDDVPFTLTPSIQDNMYAVVTKSQLDRENKSIYDVTVTAKDAGVPALSSSVTLTLQISDVNDNAPVFDRSSYEASIVENNTPGLSIFTVRARDADWKQNARVSYILEDSSVNGVPVSSYVSVSADSGVINAVRSFDYEQIKDFQFRVRAQDGGSPPLSSNVTVRMVIQDQNDNPPQVLYPVQTGGSVVAEMVPRAADVGYLVTKVVAVDVDSGQNAWLSYKLQRATDRALFEVGSQNGEIRTIRQVSDKDAVKQRLTVIVEDNGQPSRSATVIVNVAVADSFPEVLSEFTDFTQDKEYNDNLTFYLVLALAVVSFLFITCLVVIISVKIYRWRQSRILYHSSLPVIPYYPPRYSDTLGTGTLQHVYNYEVCRTTDSRKSDCKFGRGGSQNVLIMDPSSTGTMQRIQSEKSILDEPDSPLEVGNILLFTR